MYKNMSDPCGLGCKARLTGHILEGGIEKVRKKSYVHWHKKLQLSAKNCRFPRISATHLNLLKLITYQEVSTVRSQRGRL